MRGILSRGLLRKGPSGKDVGFKQALRERLCKVFVPAEWHPAPGSVLQPSSGVLVSLTVVTARDG